VFLPMCWKVVFILSHFSSTPSCISYEPTEVVRLIKVIKVCVKHFVWWSSCSQWSETKWLKLKGKCGLLFDANDVDLPGQRINMINKNTKFLLCTLNTKTTGYIYSCFVTII
jgi:hypothetical protein